MLSGRYTPIRRLGSGGMGDVLLGRDEGDPGMSRRVAIKRIRAELASNPHFREMFRREARVGLLLSHPNIVHVYDVSATDDELMLVMEYVEGRTLHDVLAAAAAGGRAIPLDVVMALALDAARGLHYAHDLRDEDGEPLHIVHRDLSPKNLLVSVDGDGKILDFGVAKATIAVDDSEGVELKGKPGYLSPEQARLEPVDHRSDIYTLGILLWEMTTGRRLYPVRGALEALEVIGRRPIPSLAEVRPVPPGWEGVVRRALSADVAGRYSTARDLQLDIEEVARSAGHVLSNLSVVATLAQLFPELALDLDADRGPGRRPTVLVVDDEPDMVEMMARTLRRSYTVETAGSVAEALAALGRAPFDVVVSDERMPERRGIELLQHVASESPRTVRIMITAYASTEVMLSAINLGHVHRFVPKPFRPGDLLAVVDEVLSGTLTVGAAGEAGAAAAAAPPQPDGAVTLVEGAGRRPAPVPSSLPWESLRHLAEPARADALTCSLLVGVAERPIGLEEREAIEWVLAQRRVTYWIHVEHSALILALPGVAQGPAAHLAGELRDAAFGVAGARVAVAVGDLSAEDDLVDVGRRVEEAAFEAWREEVGVDG